MSRWSTPLSAVAVIALISLLGVLGFRLLFGTAASTAASAVVTAAPVPRTDAGLTPEAYLEQVQVIAVRGQVERQVKEQEWTALTVGQSLAPGDSLRTDAQGQADLDFGGNSKVTVTQSTGLEVRELSRAVQRLRLSRGRVAVAFGHNGERVLRIEDETGKAVAETRGASFSVMANGQALAVATVTGTVNLKVGDAAVDVGPGQRSTATAGQAPSAVTALPLEVLLKIAATAQPGLCANVNGRAEPGAEVTVEGERVELADDGRFHRAVLRRAGLSSVKVSVREVDGRVREQVVACAVEPPARVERMKIEFHGSDGG